MLRRLRTITATAQACGKSRESLRDYLRLRPKLRARALGIPVEQTADEVAEHREARRLRVAGLRDSQEWIAILRGDLCSYCFENPVEVTDHILAASEGGTHTWENFTGACFACNSSKGTKPLLIWLLDHWSGHGVIGSVLSQQDLE
jgi:5-methylcytosine-specific restriction endonuclease McrA